MYSVEIEQSCFGFHFYANYKKLNPTIIHCIQYTGGILCAKSKLSYVALVLIYDILLNSA